MSRRIAPALVLLFLPTAASAFVQYTTSDNVTPLRWFVPGADVYFDSDGPQELDPAKAEQLVATSYTFWSNLTCSGQPTPFTFTFKGARDCVVGFDETPGASNASCVIWVKEKNAWVYGDSVLALTSLTFNDTTGEVIDADLELNDQRFVFVDASGGTDSKHPDATMYDKAPPCETRKCDLHEDDIDGFCSLYGPDAPPLPVEDDGDGDNGCCATVGGGPSPWPFLLLGSLLLLGLRGASSTRRRGH